MALMTDPSIGVDNSTSDIDIVLDVNQIDRENLSAFLQQESTEEQITKLFDKFDRMVEGEQYSILENPESELNDMKQAFV